MSPHISMPARSADSESPSVSVFSVHLRLGPERQRRAPPAP